MVVCKKKPDFKLINPFVPEPPVTACADSHPFYCLWRHQFWLSRITLSTNLCRVKRSIFQTIPEWAQFRCQGHQRKRQKNRVTLTWNFPWKSCFTTHLPFLSSNPKIPKAFLKTFRNKMKHTIIMPSKRKKWGKKSQERGQERKRKVSLRASSPIWASEVSLARTREQRAEERRACNVLL